MANAVHRLVEQHAASRPEVPAVADGRQTLTYRELNQRANALARRLNASGLTRGALAMVRMPRTTDLAVVLLSVLKAGAAYTWVEPGSADDIDIPTSFCIVGRCRGGEEQCTAIDLSAALAECTSRSGPNLPVLTRGTDIACVLPDAQGLRLVLVPHATIAALPRIAPARVASGPAAAGALDLWLGLMTGATISFEMQAAA